MVAFSEEIARVTAPGNIELLFHDRVDDAAVTGSMLSPNDIAHHLAAGGL